MKLAKPHLDVGVFSDRPEPMLDFWQNEVGLAFEETLPTGRGNRQHRHSLNGSVFKLNASAAPLPEEAAPSGYRELVIAKDGLADVRALTDPDGNRVRLVPPGTRGVVGIAIVQHVRSRDAFRHFYADAMGMERAENDVYVCGDTRIEVVQSPDAAEAPRLPARGYRYLTVQVFDADREYASIVEAGGRGAVEPATHGDVARFGFVRDPDGNWIEISQRASLTGPLPR